MNNFFFYGNGLLEPILKRYRNGHGYGSDFCLQKLLSLVWQRQIICHSSISQLIVGKTLICKRWCSNLKFSSSLHLMYEEKKCIFLILFNLLKTFLFYKKAYFLIKTPYLITSLYQQQCIQWDPKIMNLHVFILYWS